MTLVRPYFDKKYNVFTRIFLLSTNIFLNMVTVIYFIILSLFAFGCDILNIGTLGFLSSLSMVKPSVCKSEYLNFFSETEKAL